MKLRLFHISENPSIEVFEPRPSPSLFESITGDVVFAVSEKFLHNYLFPRDCPRVSFYATENTSAADRQMFMANPSSRFVVITEENWRERIQTTKLYCYEFPPDSFELLDENAGYYISYLSVYPIEVKEIDNPLQKLQQMDAEVRFIPNLCKLAEELKQSTMGFSLIRMRNAAPA